MHPSSTLRPVVEHRGVEPLFRSLNGHTSPLERVRLPLMRFLPSETKTCSATDIVVTPHCGAHSLSVEKAACEISSTGGRRRLSLFNASRCLRQGMRTLHVRITKMDTREGCPFPLWSIGESNPCSVRSMVVQVPWSGTCPPFRANKLRSLPAAQDSPLG